MPLVRFGIVLTLAFAGCAPPPSPASPSDLATTMAPSVVLAAKPPATQKVTLYVISADDALGGNVNIVGLPITVSTDGYGPVTVATDKQSSADFFVPATAESIAVHTGATGTDNREATCFVPLDVVLPLPLHRRDGWLIIHQTACS